jgi:hypothetical protein
MISLNRLPRLLYNLFCEDGDIVTLNEAMHLKQRTLKLQLSHHSDRSVLLGDLPTFLYTLFGNTKDISTLNEVIDLRRQVVQLLSSDNPNSWATSLRSPANSLNTLFGENGDVEVLKE